ncbi:MAG: ABC transporter permease, partial [Clostridia bacterium]|nr:ABC transporter permease [Clostridia bacterium]
MINLLRANFSRLRHDKVTLCLAALAAFFGVSAAAVNAVNISREGAVWVMDFSLLTYVILSPIMTSVSAALFIGSDYSDGTLRNKLIAGHRRGNIYLANLITCCFVGIMLCLIFAVPQGILGLLLGGQIQSSPTKLLMYGGLSFAVTV